MMNNRFNSILMDIQDDEIISLPICNSNSEIIFTYHLINNKDGSSCVEEILNVFSRDKTSGLITKLSLDKLVKESNVSFAKPFFVENDGLKSLSLHQQYLKLYEEYYHTLSNCKSGSSCKMIHDELLDLFEQIIPQSPLKDFYYFLGKDFFQNSIN